MDKQALLTGVGAGIGARTGRAVVERGGRVTVFDLGGEAATRTAQFLVQTKPSHSRGDVTDPQAIEWSNAISVSMPLRLNTSPVKKTDKLTQSDSIDYAGICRRTLLGRFGTPRGSCSGDLFSVGSSSSFLISPVTCWKSVDTGQPTGLSGAQFHSCLLCSAMCHQP